jgi:hypothetical protein
MPIARSDFTARLEAIPNTFNSTLSTATTCPNAAADSFSECEAIFSTPTPADQATHNGPNMSPQCLPFETTFLSAIGATFPAGHDKAFNAAVQAAHKPAERGAVEESFCSTKPSTGCVSHPTAELPTPFKTIYRSI